jgi:hypothetical protein
LKGSKSLKPNGTYSIKPLLNDIRSLADLLGVSAENIQGLFSKGGLGKIKIDKNIFGFHASNFESVCGNNLQASFPATS